MLLTTSKIIRTLFSGTSLIAAHRLPLKMLVCLSLVIALASTSCGVSDPEDENGTIGTGIMLEGTVSHALLASGTAVDVISYLPPTNTTHQYQASLSSLSLYWHLTMCLVVTSSALSTRLTIRALIGF